MSRDFWEKVLQCKHKNLSPNYSEIIYCGTPYCTGWEDHCLDCGAFISECGCGSNNGMSGWPMKRWRRIERRVDAKTRRRLLDESF